ncbi:hypothetical protein KZ829_15190 [Actinoplanes hulinensis]|uniref:Uncharacterized protein n=1 Tax=Actinoplanes hulinensis TaxID=1144547 RepID=A0ABS7B225_9ACTN|nr:hypothetical protein [Actinoplanes hulinensis]MBW6435086.1 hypothetical protein [Actinoplanes hulinensis]
MTDYGVLAGGVNQVVRVGDAVRRPTGPWPPHVHDLLYLGDAAYVREDRSILEAC